LIGDGLVTRFALPIFCCWGGARRRLCEWKGRARFFCTGG
jgi:hypothetical protein